MGRALNGFSQSIASQGCQNHLKSQNQTEQQWFSITQVSEAMDATQNKYISGFYDTCRVVYTVVSKLKLSKDFLEKFDQESW